MEGISPLAADYQNHGIRPPSAHATPIFDRYSQLWPLPKPTIQHGRRNAERVHGYPFSVARADDRPPEATTNLPSQPRRVEAWLWDTNPYRCSPSKHATTKQHAHSATILSKFDADG